MKIEKFKPHHFMVSEISVKELLETMKIVDATGGFRQVYICQAIRIRALQKIQRKGIDRAINEYTRIQPLQIDKMSHDVIRSVMSNFEDQMSPNVKRTYQARTGRAIESWSYTTSWGQFISKINKPCQESRNAWSEHNSLRINLLFNILEKNPDAKLENLSVVLILKDS